MCRLLPGFAARRPRCRCAAADWRGCCNCSAPHNHLLAAAISQGPAVGGQGVILAQAVRYQPAGDGMRRSAGHGGQGRIRVWHGTGTHNQTITNNKHCCCCCNTQSRSTPVEAVVQACKHQLVGCPGLRLLMGKEGRSESCGFMGWTFNHCTQSARQGQGRAKAALGLRCQPSHKHSLHCCTPAAEMLGWAPRLLAHGWGCCASWPAAPSS